MPKSRGSRARKARRQPLVSWLLVVALVAVGAAYGAYVVRNAVVRRAPIGESAVPAGTSPAAAGASPAATLSAGTSPAATSPVGASPAATLGPRLAIIIDDCGYSMERDGRFLRLPIPLTLSILPMTPHGSEIAAAAEAAGKSVILHLPMQPDSTGVNPGPGVIRTNMTDDQVRRQVVADLAALPPLRGANNHMGSKATSDARVMRDVLGVLKEKKLFFVDSMTAPTSLGESTARELGIPTAARDVFLDNDVTVPAIEARLREAADDALRHGHAIAIGHPNPETEQALAAMIPGLEADGVTFVPVSDLVK